MVIYRKVEIGKTWDDIRPNFPPFDNLYLEFLEVKRKLKPNLPPIPLDSYKGNAMKTKPAEIIKDARHSPKATPYQSPQRTPQRSRQHSPVKDHRRTPVPSPTMSEEDPLLDALGDDDKKEVLPDMPRVSPHKSTQRETPQETAREEKSETKSANEEKPKASTYEEIEEERQDYLYKLKFFRKRMPDVDVPPYSEHSDLDTLKKIYNNAMREVQTEENFSWYKTTLVSGFLLVEFVMTQWVGINFTGYANIQSKRISSYERLLMELGEREYASFGSSLPVEVRLCALILFNAAIFYIGKLIEERGGDTISSLFTSIFGAQIPTSARSESQTKSTRRQRKRRGPSISPEDIRKMTD